MSRGVGLYIGRKHVVAVAVSGSSKHAAFEGYAIEPIQPESLDDSSTVKAETPETAALRRALEKIKAIGASVNVALSPQLVVTRNFLMPNLPKKERSEAIQYEASRHTHFKISESIFSYHENFEVQNSTSITVSAVKRRFIQSIIIQLRRASANPTKIEPAYNAFARAATFFGVYQPQKSQAWIWMDSDNSVNITLLVNGSVFLSQDFRLAGDTTADQSKFHDELRGSFEYLKRKEDGAKVENVVLAGFGDLGGWSTFLQQHFSDIQTEIFEVSTGDLVKETDASALFIAWGLALGKIGYVSPLGQQNLLPEEERFWAPGKFLISVLIAVVVGVGLMGLVRVGFEPTLRNLIRAKKQAEAPLSQYGALGNSSLTNLNQIKAALQVKAGAIKKFQDRSAPAASILTRVAQGMPTSAWFSSFEYLGEWGEPKSRSSKKQVEVLHRRILLEGYVWTGNSERESELINQWARKLNEDVILKSYFGEFSISEIKQQNMGNRLSSRFVLKSES